MQRFKEWVTGSVMRFAPAAILSLEKEGNKKMNNRNELLNEMPTNRNASADERAYESLEIEVISFENEDVITASGGNESPWDTN